MRGRRAKGARTGVVVGLGWIVLNAGDRGDASNGFATFDGVLVALRAEAVGEMPFESHA